MEQASMSRPAAVLLAVAALLVSFHLGRESLREELRDSLARAFSGTSASAASATRPFRIYEVDVIQRNWMGDPWYISCPRCCGYPQIEGYDRFTADAIQCSQCNGDGIADVRTMLRPVVVVSPPEPSDYPRPTHRQR